MPIDAQILEGCIAGKRKFQYMLYKKYAATMLAVCNRYCSNRMEAEDVLQEGFLKVFLHISGYRGEGSLEGWIKRIMINHALTAFRKNKQIPFQEDIEKIDETEITDNTEESFPAEPIPAEILFSLIQSLPQGYRMVFNMYVLEEYSHKEIAEILNISENTSKTQLMKARRLLRKKLNEMSQTKHFALANGK